MRFGVYILVVMLFLGFTVGEAAAYLTIYNTSVVSPGQTINISVFWSGEDDPDQRNHSIKKADGTVVSSWYASTGNEAHNFAIQYTAPQNYAGNLTLWVEVGWSATGKKVSRTLYMRVRGTAKVTTSITSPPSEVAPGGTVNLSASASTNVSGGSISSYSWSATHGSFNTSSGSSVTWTAPWSNGVTARITARATDSAGNSGSKTISISVVAPEPEDPEPEDPEPEDPTSNPTTTNPPTTNPPTTNPPTTNPPQVVTPPRTPNEKPVVSITASETEVYPNEMVQLTAEADDSDGYIISYQWTADAGDFSSTNESETTWVAPDTIGTAAITVVVNDNENATADAIVDINIIARPPEPTTLQYISGNQQSGLIESTLAEPFVVQVYDQYADPMKDITVTFAIIQGAASLSHESVDTDEEGIAQSMLTLGGIPTTAVIEASIAEIAQSVTFEAVSTILQFDLMLQAGLNFIHVPLDIRMVNGEVATVLSLGDLYNILGGENVINYFAVYDSQTQEWLSFFVPDDIATQGDILLAEDIGIAIHLKSEVNIRLGGKPLGSDGQSVVQLNPGLNFVGLPLRDSRIIRVSDLFAVDSPEDSIIAIIIVNNGKIMTIRRADDPGDIEIVGGQSFIIISQYQATIEISGEGWQ